MSEVSIGDITARIRADTTDFTRGLQTALQSLAAFQQSLTAVQSSLRAFQQQVGQAPTQAAQAFTTFNTTLQETHQTFVRVTQSATGFGSAWRQALAVAGGLGIATSVGGIVQAMVAFGQSVVKVGTDLQTLRASLTSIAGGLREGRESFQFLIDTSNRYGLSLQELAGQYRSLSAATRGTALEGQGTKDLLTALAAASRTYGLSTEQTGRALQAFQQIISKGKVEQEELRGQLGEALPGALQIAARAYEVTTAALTEMITKGLDGVEFTRKFTTQLTTELPKGTQTVETAAGAFNRLGNEILLLKDAIAKSGLLQFLGDVASKLAGILSQQRQAATQNESLIAQRSSQGLQGVTVAPGDRAALDALAAQTIQAEARLRVAGDALARAREQTAERPGSSFAGSTAAETRRVAEAQAAVDAALQAEVTLKTQLRTLDRERRGLAARSDMEGTDTLRLATEATKEAEIANTKLKQALDATGTSLKGLNVQAKETPAVFGSLTGDADAKVTLLDRRLKILREDLEKVTTTITSRPSSQGVIPPELQAQKATLEADLVRTEAQKTAIQEATRAAETATRTARQAQLAATREAEQARLKNLREFEQEARTAFRAKVEGADLLGLGLAPEQEKALQDQRREQTRLAAERQREVERLAAERQREVDQQLRQAADFDARLQAAIEQQQAARAQRPEVRLRAEATRGGLTLTPEQEGQLGRLTALREEQERLNEATRIYEEMAGRIGDAFTGALTSIADHTKSVSAAFRDMGRSIMQSLAQTAASEGWKQLISIGAGLITQYFGGGNTATASQAAATIAGFRAKGYAEGGVVTRPTLAMLGENPATSPEIVMNRQQMQQFIASATRAAPTAGGQAAGSAGISIINVTSTEEAQRQKSQQESMGRQVVLNYIMDDLSQGNGSKINRAISTLQR